MILMFIPIIAIVLGQFGVFSGSAPLDLGLNQGRLKPPSKTTNSVSSQANLYKDTDLAFEYATMDPLPIQDSDSFFKLKTVISSFKEAKLIEENSTYLRYEFQTTLMKFVDDVEFYLNTNDNVIHFRSASRLGRKDLGKNRARIEEIKKRYFAR